MGAFSGKNMEWAMIPDNVTVRFSTINMQTHDPDHAVQKLVVEWY